MLVSSLRHPIVRLATAYCRKGPSIAQRPSELIAVYSYLRASHAEVKQTTVPIFSSARVHENISAHEISYAAADETGQHIKP